jgi:hypothetical protein
MAKMLCSLCRGVKEAEPLDMDDFAFSKYVRLMRSLGISKHTGPLGVCKGCMPSYRKMEADFRKSLTLYGIAGAVFAITYFYFTSNFLISLVIGMLALSLSVFHYCPPLKQRS